MRALTVALFFAITFNVYGQVPDYVPSDGLVAWYPFNGNANDESGNGNDGALNGPTLTDDRHSNNNSAYYFSSSGCGTRIDVDNMDLSSTTNGFSLSFWIKKTGNGCIYPRIFDFYSGQASNSWGAAWGNSDNLDWINTSLSTGTWYHVVYCYDGVNFSSFLNSVSQVNIPYTKTLPFGNDVAFGRMNHPAWDAFNGNLDDIGIWNKVLSSQEIQDLYSAEISFTGCTDYTACNYNPEAIEDDGSCDYTCCPGPGCCDEGTYWNEATQTCIVTNPTDTNFDGCTDLNDLMDILSAYGDCAVSEFTCGDLVSHAGYDYSTVQIGDQCWFSENCRYLPVVSPSSEGNTTDPYYYVYGYEGTDVITAQAEATYSTYGVLYNWPAVMELGICPSGWHIPTDGEWTQLTDFLGGQGVAGGKMKSTGTIEAGTGLWHSPNAGATNSSGWTGLPGGYRYSGGFYLDGNDGYWWSASESGSNSWRRHLYYYNDNVYRNYDYRYLGFSARCVRD